MEERYGRELRVGVQRDGLRADVYLALRLPRLSRQRARDIVRGGDLHRDGQPLKPASRVRDGDVLTLWRGIPDEPPPEEAPPLTVIHDSERLLVLDKPAGLAVHPTARYLKSTVTWLLGARAAPGERTPNPCHRLDRETSGVLVLARCLDTERRIKRAFATGLVTKTYLALVEGAPGEEAFSVDVPIAPGGGVVSIRMEATPSAPPARTDFRVVARLGERALLACRPHTGRTHQIRAHLALAGWPIVGDKMYGVEGPEWFARYMGCEEPEEARALVGTLAWPRQCLHALRLELDASLGVTPLVFEAPWPADLPALPPTILQAARALDAPRASSGWGCSRPRRSPPATPSPPRCD